jgi:hypothetical protein
MAKKEYTQLYIVLLFIARPMGSSPLQLDIEESLKNARMVNKTAVD